MTGAESAAMKSASPRVRVWTAKHAGSLDLLRVCLASGELSRWVEETREDEGARCAICMADRWIPPSLAVPLNYRELAAWPIRISRLEGMREAADKAETERALERCRAAGLPAYDASYFPPT